ncbi:hypothetical protein BCV72DRAFT_251853 [Rhizopus microsporus var. microsporus]|uniref:C2H2-type domain-containing protein n=1 Tax=Rhizopus microsporus var. microsporus TaxID=86635 RepID=A0A1X0QUN4_RHIZD|nr:hypothetical protein BCV72DRAFT_251853 [Rhizopus microsporus var. microsporus]
MVKTQATTRTRRNEPKIFRCTGYGDCNMVFSRSEHLARHARKHTGEKPYKCIVPNCDRTFSRIDNMMQHTHTHNRNRKKGFQEKKPSVPDDNMMVNVPPRSPKIEFQQPFNHLPPYEQRPLLPPPLPVQEHYYHYPPLLPPPPPSVLAPQGPYPWPYPSPPNTSASFVEQKKMDSPKKPLFQKLDSNSTRCIELSTPIQQLNDETSDTTDDERMSPMTDDTTTTVITADEYEALQGFGQFCTKPREYKEIPVRCIRFLPSQVYAFRQQVDLVQESFSRGTAGTTFYSG